MKRSLFGFTFLFILLTTFTPKNNELNQSNFVKIKFIYVDNNSILKEEEIKKKLNFLYDKSLFFLNEGKIEKILQSENFIESFSVKKIFPDSLRITIEEKKPIAVIQNKKKKFYISDKGNFINFFEIEKYKNLPTVFGDGKKFLQLYLALKKINFPYNEIKSFYQFESGRWDLELKDDKLLKLPMKDYLTSLENFLDLKMKINLKGYKTFDYRIKDQLIMN